MVFRDFLLLMQTYSPNVKILSNNCISGISYIYNLVENKSIDDNNTQIWAGGLHENSLEIYCIVVSDRGELYLSAAFDPMEKHCS